MTITTPTKERSGLLPVRAQSVRDSHGHARGFLSFYLPRRVMRDVHRSITAGASQRRHRYTGKWLTPSDPLVLAGAASDDVGATVHLRLRLVDIASIKGRENLVTVAVGQYAGAVNVFLRA